MMKKFFLLILICCVLMTSYFVPHIQGKEVYHTENDSNLFENAKTEFVIVGEQTHADNKTERLKKTKLKELSNNSSSITRDEYKIELINRHYIINKKLGYAGNQPTYTTFPKSGGGFFWQDGDFNTSFSYSLSDSVVSIKTSLGSIGSTRGYGIYLESQYVERPCKLIVSKDYEILEYGVFKRSYGQDSNQWVLDYKYIEAIQTCVRLSTEAI